MRRGVRGPLGPLPWERVVGLAASVVIGCALADAAPGVWL